MVRPTRPLGDNSLVMVTGGAGFIGANLVRYLLEHTGARVVTVDKLTYAGNLASLGPALEDSRHEFVQADVADTETVRGLYETHRPDVVMHLAAESHVDRSIDGPADFINTNIVGTFVMLDEANRYWTGLSSADSARFVFHHISTDEVFGSLGPTGLFTESSPYQPNSPYSASKAASDHLARAWYHTYGLPVVLTNCSNNYGPYQFPEKLIPLMILRARAGESLPVYGAGDNVRDWLYVTDHVRGLVRVVEDGRPGETYNLGGNNEQTNLDVVHAICAILDEVEPLEGGRSHRERVTFVPDRPGHDQRYAIDAGKAARELGWQPLESFESGLRRTVDWYLSNREWCDQVRDGTYSGERLGLR